MKTVFSFVLILFCVTAYAQTDPVYVPVRTDVNRPNTASWMNMYIHTDGRVMLMPRVGNAVEITRTDFSSWRTSVESRLSAMTGGSQIDPSAISQSANYRFVTDVEKSNWNNKQNALGYTPLNPINNLSEFTSSASVVRTNLGLGSLAIQNASAVAFTGGTITTLTSLSSAKLLGSGSTPTITTGPGAGTGATVSINGSDVAGTITVTTGTTPAMVSQIIRVVFNSAYASVPFVVYAPTNDNATAIHPAVSKNTTYFDLNSGPVALSANTVYSFDYHVIGK